MDEDAPQFVLFENCSFDGESVNASGRLRDVLPEDRLLIKANGGDVIMRVVAITATTGESGIRWSAIDEASWLARCQPLELRQ